MRPIAYAPQILGNYLRTIFQTKAMLISAAMLITAMAYLMITSVKIQSIHHNEAPYHNTTMLKGAANSPQTFITIIHSHIPQTILLNIAAQDSIQKVEINGKEVRPAIKYKKGRTSYKAATYGDNYSVELSRGINPVVVTTFSKTGKYNFAVNTKKTLFEFFLLFTLLALPIIYFTCQVLYQLTRSPKYTCWIIRTSPVVYILFTAVVLRFFYFQSIGFIQFQHDYYGHIEYIKFFAEHFSIPLGHQGWEFPQQPLYYAVNGIFFNLSTWLGYSEKQALFFISGFSTLLCSIALIYSYTLINLVTDRRFIHYCVIGILGFTPTFIFMSSRISNDPWSFALTTIALYYIVASYKNDFKQYFFMATLFSSLALLTKVSDITVWLVFTILLITTYLKYPEQLKNRCIQFSWIGLFVLGFTLFKSYSPVTGEFFMVNSGIWGGQDLRPLDANFFMSFNFSELLGQAHAFWNDQETEAIKRSFFTYQYGTMLFGEFDYKYWKGQDLHLTITMQYIIVLALLIPIGFFISLLRPKTLLEWSMLAMLGANFVLLIKFVFAYPSSSNMDFRYYGPCLFPMAYFAAKGLVYLADQHKMIKHSLCWLLGSLFLLEAIFILSLST